MKKLLLTIFVSLLFTMNAYADGSYEAAFKKALDNHQYYFKYKGKSYTTDTKDKKFDFFDHGYKDFRSSAKYMVENYPDDKSISCFIFKGKYWGFDRWKINKDSDKFYTYLDYDIDGWQNKVIITSANKLIKVIFNQDSGCYRRDTYIQVLFEDKIFYDSRKDFEELTSDGWSIFLNINHYIDKDLNNNGKQELFIDAGYTIGNNWLEKYYLFEYDESSIKLVKKFIAGDWTERLGVSDHFKAKFKVTEEVLAKIINRNFSENVYVECIEGDCINGNGTFDSRFGNKYVGEFKDGKYHGQGTETDVNGDKYIGEFKNGLKNGQGTLIFRYGKPNDQGTYIYTDGNKYVGEFKDGLKSGQGTLIYADGEKYVGEFEYGEPIK